MAASIIDMPRQSAVVGIADHPDDCGTAVAHLHCRECGLLIKRRELPKDISAVDSTRLGELDLLSLRSHLYARHNQN